MKIVLRENGGLGNQLFQYAALIYYSKRYGADEISVVVDPPWNAWSYGRYPRPCMLQHFSVSAALKDRSLSDRVILTDKPWLLAVTAPFKKAFRVQVFKQQVTDYYRFLRDLPLEPEVKTLYLAGYWENYSMVEDVALELRRELAFREPAVGNNLEVLDQIRRSRNPVSVHVRRGDATFSAERKVILSMDYYTRAIARFKESLVDPVFFVFSDDIPFVRENLPRDVKAVFVHHNDTLAAYEDLRLMSSCHHHIIANSTFSWWGAWLNPRPDKVVVAPRYWYLQKDNYYPSLFPPDWILDSVEVAEKQFA